MEEIKLTIEQEFNLAAFMRRVGQMDEAGAKASLVSLYHQYLMMESYYRSLAAKNGLF